MRAEIVAAIAAVIMCAFSCGGLLIYIGRSLGTLNAIGAAVKVALAKTDRHDLELADMKARLVKVETKQEDCGSCP